MHRDRACAKGLDLKPEPCKFRCKSKKPFRFGFAQLNNFRRQQSLLFNAVVCELRFKTFIDKPFMRGMLVDNDKAAGTLGDNVVFMNLRARRAERILNILRFHDGFCTGGRSFL